MSTARPPLAVEAFVSDDARRGKTPITVKDHAAFRASIALPPAPAVDPIDELVEELRNPTAP